MTTTSNVTGTGTVSQDLLDSINPKAKKDSASGLQGNFLTMLTTQLKNQDPMNPLDNSQMTSQLAQISTVDGISQLNETVKSLLGSYQSAELTQAAGLVGHGVLVSGNHLQLVQGQAIGGFELTQPADKVNVQILDSNGIEVANVDLGPQEAGSQVFTWDGKTASGATAADGKYSIKVTAALAGQSVDASALQLGTVASVVNGSQGVTLEVGQLGSFSLSDIKQILS